MSTPDLVQAFYERLWNAGDLAAVGEVLASDVVFRGSLGTEAHGHEEFAAYVRGVRTALADYRCDILACVTEGDEAFARMRFSGRHVGELRGVAPTGRLVEWHGAALFTMSGGRIVEIWVLGDLAGLDLALTRASAGARTAGPSARPSGPDSSGGA